MRRDEHRSIRRVSVLFLAAAVVTGGSLTATGQDRPEAEPRPSGLLERAGVSLVQLDVTVTGPGDVVADLGKEDFRVTIGGRTIDFEVDRLCREPAKAAAKEEAAEVTVEPEQVAVVTPSLGPTTYLFYFDQSHLTMAGRQEGIDKVRDLVDRLIVDGNRGSIVSSAERLKTIVEMTTDRDELKRGLDLLENTRDPDMWDLYSQKEETRIREVLAALEREFAEATALARQHFTEELWRAERELHRFSITVGKLATEPTPKVVLYLADTMRRNAGEHYLNMFGELAKAEIAQADIDRLSDIGGSGQSFDAAGAFDEVVNEASAHGTRIYAIQAEGMVAPTPGIPSSRIGDAQDTLSGMALETGGRAFLRGIRPSKIAQGILEDLQCLYLVSFKPDALGDDLRLDRPLPVRVTFPELPKVSAQVRGRLVIQSESTRLVSRLLSAYTSSGTDESGYRFRAAVIPTGYADGEFSGLLQLSVERSALPATTWDIGAGIVSLGKFRETSARMTTNRRDLPVATQQSLTFPPGEFEIMAVAHDVDTGEIASTDLSGQWPDPKASPASTGPIALLQPFEGAFLSDGSTRQSGPLALSEDQPLYPDRPTAVRTIVCRGRGVGGTLRVERTVLGAGDRPVFDGSDDLDLTKDRCAVIQDLVKSDIMGSGTYTYRLRALDGKGVELASAERKFHVWDRDEPLEELMGVPATAR